MVSKLIVKNFGPIEHVELDLRNVNVFIGPQSTGKSALAKLYTIFKAPRKFFYKNALESVEAMSLNGNEAFRQFNDVLEEYNINSFLKTDTEISFDSELHTIEYKNNTLYYKPKILNAIKELDLLATNFEENKNEIINIFKALSRKFILFHIRARELFHNSEKYNHKEREKIYENIDVKKYPLVINIIKSSEEDLSTNAALYIPAERNFINIIKKSSLNLLLNNVPIPRHILSFGAELEKLDAINEIDLSFIKKDIRYKIVQGEDRIFTDNQNSIKLTEAASGIQSVIPILMPIMNSAHVMGRAINSTQAMGHRSFVIEEPELNLFPTAQYELIQILESGRRDSNWEDYGTIHSYTTHSPYILSALNNLLYASKVKRILFDKYRAEASYEKEDNSDELVDKIVKADIDPDSFTAYQINDGHATSIFNRKTGLIEENFIDESSDKINEDFEALMELTK